MAGVAIRARAVADAHEVESLRIADWQTAYRGILSDEYLDALTVDAGRRRRALATPMEGRTGSVAVQGGAIRRVGRGTPMP